MSMDGHITRSCRADAKQNKLPWLKGYTVVKTNNMVVKIRDDENVSCWVHRTQLRYIPDRPEHLHTKQLIVPIPVVPKSPTRLPQPPIGERKEEIGSSNNRRKSRIPRLIESERPRQNIPARKPVTPIVTQNMQQIASGSQQPKVVAARKTRQIANDIRSKNTTVTNERPKRRIAPPSKFKDYVRY